MALTADDIIDRRQLRKKVGFWRIMTFMVLAIFLVGFSLLLARESVFSIANSDHIARIKITGVITNDEPMLKLIERVKDEDRIKAVIVNISSPGGSVVGGEAMYEAVRELAEAKPVAASVGSLAASAGYMIAAACDHIVARRSSIVGSIGVLFQYADASRLLENIGVEIKAVKSSPLKAEPSPFSPTSEEAVEMIDRVIKDTYTWFVDLVTERRDISRQKVLRLADGSIFTGNQGLENGLVDALGGEAVARKWLTETHGISEQYEIVEYKPKRPGDSLFNTPAIWAEFAKHLGLSIDHSDVQEIKAAIQHLLLLDGLVSIWQVSK